MGGGEATLPCAAISGCIFTSLPCICGYFMDEWGRRDTIILGAGIFLIGCCVQAHSRTELRFVCYTLALSGMASKFDALVLHKDLPRIYP